jgi:tetratricopeptide (TPR) repeat protein
VRFYSERIASDPQHYPSYALLGEAYLDEARETLDPRRLADARAALARSMEIQPNFEAMKAMAAVSNFSHRFEDAIRWATTARDTWPTDPEITALLVEAHMGLGEYDAAEKLLPAPGAPIEDFHSAAALGEWLTSQRRPAEAEAAFAKAAALARAQDVPELTAWAETSAGAAWLDAGKWEKARPHFDAAALLDPTNRRLRIHEAEYSEALGRHTEALAGYESLLAERDDPEVHRRAASIARALGRTAEAQRHFDAAERGFRRALDAGEIYTLGGLARLEADAGVRLQEALALATRNLEYKRDVEARATLARVQEALGRSR